MYVNADYYTPVDSTFMTTGEIAPVKDTPMDFTTPKAVGKDINNYDFVQLKNGNGYDHNWVLNTKGDISQVAARLTSPETGITLEVYTNEPGIQVNVQQRMYLQILDREIILTYKSNLLWKH